VRDAYGDEITNDRMTVDCDTVSVDVTIYPVKSVPVNIDIKGKPEDGYGVGEIQYQPQNINVAGSEELLEDFKEIDVQDISISGLNENLQTTVDLNDYLPEGVFIAQSNNEIVVNVIIEKYEKKTFKPEVSDITLKNEQDEEYTYDVILSDGYSITVSGLTDAIEGVDLDDLNLELDCSELAVGENFNVTMNMTKEDDLEYDVSGGVTVVVEEK
jgi:YbbR domain-containing protein